MDVDKAVVDSDMKRRRGKGGKGKKSPCADGEKPTCPDGSEFSKKTKCVDEASPVCADGTEIVRNGPCADKAFPLHNIVYLAIPSLPH